MTDPLTDAERVDGWALRGPDGRWLALDPNGGIAYATLAEAEWVRKQQMWGQPVVLVAVRLVPVEQKEEPR